MDRREWDKLLQDAMEDHIRDYAQAGVDMGMDQIGQLGITTQRIANDKIVEYLSTYSFDKIRGINATTANKLRDIMLEVRRTGGTVDDIKNAILNDSMLSNVGISARAEVIARTESSNAALTGRALAWREVNAQSPTPPFIAMRFKAYPGCCDICDAYDGTEQPIDASPDLKHPNCRCAWESVINPDYGGNR